ncbi:hypothetical protein LSH36_874g01046 [Paralvinella palmiformis]|uniref:Reverse transcriptase domain-containing protein n=1 Tax=Paralvinella palmiformis TaxID=53620 RepID=A0AAD9IY53_9ANNE|nr:hypothetical protein LSH36_874g01046 [Paralvinella palmiformis]
MAAAALIGNIGEFNSDKEERKNYQKRLEIWMIINKIENDNKVNVILALSGAGVFELFMSLVTPDDVAGISYSDLANQLEEYYKPKQSVVGKIYTFCSRNQQEKESVTDFILALKKLRINCEFGDSLKTTLRDRLLIGVRSLSIKTRLFSLALTTDLSCGKACSEAQAMELAHNETKSCQSTLVVTQNSKLKEYLNVNTHKGLYQHQRLTYGISTAPSIFQIVMDQVLSGLGHVTCYLDDIMIA